jgi:hypothetical protein
MSIQSKSQISALLKQHIRKANIVDDDVGHIEEKLTQRLSANVVSYLELCILKVLPNTLFNQDDTLESHKKRNEYAETVSNYISVNTLHI